MKLLLHMCCAPCSVYVINKIREEKIKVEGFFYNPNIHPYDEYIRRMETVKEYSKKENLKVHYFDEYLENDWKEYKGEQASRCEMCYYKRLDKAAKFAKENGFDAFTTSLLVSPYQKHNYIKSLGYDLAKQYGLYFYYKDFRTGYREGQFEAKELNLYRQKYCGCIISYNESDYIKKQNIKSNLK